MSQIFNRKKIFILTKNANLKYLLMIIMMKIAKMKQSVYVMVTIINNIYILDAINYSV